VTDDPDVVRVAPLMQQIESGVRERIRQRLIERGAAAYDDAELFERVCLVLQRAADRAAAGGPDRARLRALLLPELIGDEVEWTLNSHLEFASHRRWLGKAVIFAKRRLVLPLTRWLFEYSRTNFRRQQELNLVLLACIEEIAIENARLRREMTTRQSPPE
jgi:hypothetical protein